MKEVISKARTRKVRSRNRQAKETRQTPLLQKPVFGILICFVLWLAALAVMHGDRWLGAAVARIAPLAIVSDAVFLLAGLFVAGLLLQLVHPRTAMRNDRILLLAIVTLIGLLAARFTQYASSIMFPGRTQLMLHLLPLTLAPLMAAILLNGAVGAVIGMGTAFGMAVMLGHNLEVFLAGAVASVVAAALADRVRTRTRVLRIGMVAGLAQIIVVLGHTALFAREMTVMHVLHQAAACLLSGFGSALLALLLLPVFESLFHITTNLTLLELSDLSHPLLQRLAIEAPGTYHHSLVVANLAQAAADAIGVNSLLARVCAYFHDVGKLTKPEFFSENIRRETNPHDELPPSMSTLIITAHVKEGLTLAMLHKLPDPVKAVICEHHGTSLVSCFHHKAVSRQDEDAGNGPVSEESFRYPGPRPSFPESAIICLADSVEAASRSIEKPTPNHIEQLVASIINRRIADGQLDNCQLTLNQLARVRRSFVFSLMNMLHGRVPYPTADEEQAAATTRPAAAGERARDAGTARPADGAPPPADA